MNNIIKLDDTKILEFEDILLKNIFYSDKNNEQFTLDLCLYKENNEYIIKLRTNIIIKVCSICGENSKCFKSYSQRCIGYIYDENYDSEFNVLHINPQNFSRYLYFNHFDYSQLIYKTILNELSISNIKWIIDSFYSYSQLCIFIEKSDKIIWLIQSQQIKNLNSDIIIKILSFL